jgi:hypothetical protein
MQLPDRTSVSIALGNKFTVTPQIRAAIKAVPGVQDVRDL